MDRRFKIFYINEDILEAFLNWKHVECIKLPVFQQLPEDATLHCLYYDHIHQAFGIIVYSETFDIIPEGNELPKIEGVLNFVTLEIKDDYFDEVKL